MDKPKEILLLERFIQIERKTGATQDEIIERMLNATRWFIEKRLKSKLNRLEQSALGNSEHFLVEAITDEITEVLNSD